MPHMKSTQKSKRLLILGVRDCIFLRAILQQEEKPLRPKKTKMPLSPLNTKAAEKQHLHYKFSPCLQELHIQSVFYRIADLVPVLLNLRHSPYFLELQIQSLFCRISETVPIKFSPCFSKLQNCSMSINTNLVLVYNFRSGPCV